MAGCNVPQAPIGSELRLLLLGKTGSGKSETGNVILDEGAFRSSGASSSVTKETVRIDKVVRGRQLIVVDTPGTVDTKNPEGAIKEIASSVVKCSEGYDAFVLIVKYGSRLTPEERTAVKQVEEIFGQDFGKYCVLVMTGGDTFAHDHRYDNITFDQYLQQQELTSSEASINFILSKISGGAVLFNNLEQDQARRAVQVNALIKKVDVLRRKNTSRYTNDFFQTARKELAKNNPESEVAKILCKDIKKRSSCTIL